MKNNLDNLIEKAQSAQLTAEEKASLRFRVSQYLDANPVKISSPFSIFSFMQGHHYIPATILAFLLISGGTSMLAQSSLPGDLLYSMKINVNENVESLLAFNNKQSAEIAAIQALRRLNEAEILAVSGNLQMEKNDEIKTSFSKKVEMLNDTFAKLEEEGNSEAALEVLAKFDTDVKNKVEVLSKAGTNENSSTTASASDIVAFIEEKHGKSEEVISDGLNVRAMSIESASSSLETTQPPEANTFATPKLAATSTDSAATSTVGNQSTTTELRKETNIQNKVKNKSKINWSWKND